MPPRKKYADTITVRPRSPEERVLLEAVAAYMNGGNLSGFIVDAAVKEAKQIVQAVGHEVIMEFFQEQQAAQQEQLRTEAAAFAQSLAEIPPTPPEQ
jgi:uncharacterized protein (DUF1778 family)